MLFREVMFIYLSFSVHPPTEQVIAQEVSSLDFSRVTDCPD